MTVDLLPRQVTGGSRFLLDRSDFVPAYVKTHEAGLLAGKVEEALSHMGPSCRVCSRFCQRVDRMKDEFGVCRVGRHARVSTAFPHLGEEDVLRGWHGSGTIFFAWCNLRCVFCQNYETSQDGEGQLVDAASLAKTMLRLQEMGCHNINLVTPEHVVPQIVEALPVAIELGLRLPIVYNTSAYDSIESLRVMDGLVDIYMPDFKMWSSRSSRKFLVAPDYPEVAREAIAEMHRQVGDLHVDENGLALRGLLVRHLVMPGLLDQTERILGWLASLSEDTYVNVMDQYRPAWKATTEPRHAEINRRVTLEEFERAVSAARSAGLWRLDTRWRRMDLSGRSRMILGA